MAYYALQKGSLPIGEYGMYLRKSRKDAEAEARGEGETLKRHEETLTRLAEKYGIIIPEKYIFREVVSGENIEARPEVQRMLSMVNDGTFKGIFVMEVERLARGDTSDQGTVAKAFKYSNTLIITPVKIYDPEDEADEEYFEFGLFMSRREYKTITRRLQRGRIAAASEGLYIAAEAPYGYRKVKADGGKGFTLEKHPDENYYVELMFKLCRYGEVLADGTKVMLGATRIADKLNSLGSKPRKGNQWTKSSVKDILRNPVYAGMIRWGYKKEVKFIENGKVRKRRTRGKNYYTLVKGLHPATVSWKLFCEVQDILDSRGHAPIPGSQTLKYPFAGLIYCGKCGRLMTRLAKSSKTPYDAIKCMNKNCDNVSSPLYVVEDVILQSMRIWLNDFKVKWNIEKLNDPYSNSIKTINATIDHIQSEIEKLTGQLDKLYDFLEQGVYSVDIFQQRSKKLNIELDSLNKSLNSNKKELDRLMIQAAYNDVYIPKAEHLLDEYHNIDSAYEKNEILKELIHKITYTKNTPNKKGERENRNFEIVIDPKVVQF